MFNTIATNTANLGFTRLPPIYVYMIRAIIPVSFRAVSTVPNGSRASAYTQKKNDLMATYLPVPFLRTQITDSKDKKNRKQQQPPHTPIYTPHMWTPLIIDASAVPGFPLS